MAQSKVTAGKDQDRLVSALAYLVFFLPLIVTPNSKAGRFHANQGLVLLVFAVLVRVIGLFLPIIGWFIIWPLGALTTFVLFIIGFFNGLGGKQAPLPLIGKYELIR